MLLQKNRPHKIAIIIHGLSLILTTIFLIILIKSENLHNPTSDDLFILTVCFLAMGWFSLLGLPTAVLSLRKNQRDPYRLIGLKNLCVQSFTIPSSLVSVAISALGIIIICQIGDLGVGGLALYIYSVWNSMLAIMIFPISLIGCSLIWYKRKRITKKKQNL